MSELEQEEGAVREEELDGEHGDDSHVDHEHDADHDEELGDDELSSRAGDDEADDAGDEELGDEAARQQQQQSKAATEEDIERSMTSLAKEATRHFNRVHQIMGEDAEQLLPCELCWPAAPGLRWPAIPDEETRERVKLALGMGGLDRYREAADAQRCATCDGWGQVRSGSEVVGQLTLKCLSCDGKGWTSASEQRRGAPLAAVPPPPVDEANAPPEPMPDLDPWGTPSDDPEYGKMPQFRTDEGRARIAARLAAAG